MNPAIFEYPPANSRIASGSYCGLRLMQYIIAPSKMDAFTVRGVVLDVQMRFTLHTLGSTLHSPNSHKMNPRIESSRRLGTTARISKTGSLRYRRVITALPYDGLILNAPFSFRPHTLLLKSVLSPMYFLNATRPRSLMSGGSNPAE